MKGAFLPDSRFIRFLTKVCDLLLLNVLTAFLSLTVVAAGTAMISLYTAVIKMMQEEEDGEPVSCFFHALRENFSPSVPAAPLLFADVLLLALLRYALIAETLVFSPAAFVFLAIAAAFLTALLSYLFPLLARFENTFSRHLANAWRLAAANLPVTFLLVTVNLLPLLLAVFLPGFFPLLAVFWLMIGIAASAYLNSFYLCQIFDKLSK